MLIAADDEILDIVDQSDQVLGQAPRSIVYAQQLGFRVINAFLLNRAGQVWLPRRAAHKKLFPLCWDTSVGGHVMAGETYEQAFMRELQEELQLDAAQIQYQLVAKFNPPQHQVSAHMQVYFIYQEATPAANPQDFIESHWFTLLELRALIEKSVPMKGDLPKLITLLNLI